jgi:hypothetical protein
MSKSDNKIRIIPPDTLEIVLKTSIPGHQTVRYKPAMRDPENTSKTVYFTTKVRLDKNTMSNVSSTEPILANMFTNKGQFDSLVQSHGSYKELTLKQSVETGIIDNNIQVTLKSLFPEDKTIQIDGQSYVIVDMQWRKGDWEMALKSDSRRVIETQDNEMIDIKDLNDKLRCGSTFLDCNKKSETGKGVYVINTPETVDASNKKTVEEELVKFSDIHIKEFKSSLEKDWFPIVAIMIDTVNKPETKIAELNGYLGKITSKQKVTFKLNLFDKNNNFFESVYEAILEYNKHTREQPKPDVIKYKKTDGTVVVEIPDIPKITEAVLARLMRKQYSTASSAVSSSLSPSVSGRVLPNQIAELSPMFNLNIVCFRKDNNVLAVDISSDDKNDKWLFMYFNGKQYSLLYINNRDGSNIAILTTGQLIKCDAYTKLLSYVIYYKTDVVTGPNYTQIEKQQARLHDKVNTYLVNLKKFDMKGTWVSVKHISSRYNDLLVRSSNVDEIKKAYSILTNPPQNSLADYMYKNGGTLTKFVGDPDIHNIDRLRKLYNDNLFAVYNPCPEKLQSYLVKPELIEYAKLTDPMNIDFLSMMAGGALARALASDGALASGGGPTYGWFKKKPEDVIETKGYAKFLEGTKIITNPMWKRIENKKYSIEQLTVDFYNNLPQQTRLTMSELNIFVLGFDDKGGLTVNILKSNQTNSKCMFLFEENGYYGILCFQNGETLVLDLDEMSESIVGDPELTKTIDELQKRVYKAEKKYEEAKNVEERAINDIRVAENNILRANRELKRVEADAIKNEQIAVKVKPSTSIPGSAANEIVKRKENEKRILELVSQKTAVQEAKKKMMQANQIKMQSTIDKNLAKRELDNVISDLSDAKRELTGDIVSAVSERDLYKTLDDEMTRIKYALNDSQKQRKFKEFMSIDLSDLIDGDYKIENERKIRLLVDKAKKITSEKIIAAAKAAVAANSAERAQAINADAERLKIPLDDGSLDIDQMNEAIKTKKADAVKTANIAMTNNNPIRAKMNYNEAMRLGANPNDLGDVKEWLDKQTEEAEIAIKAATDAMVNDNVEDVLTNIRNALKQGLDEKDPRVIKAVDYLKENGKTQDISITLETIAVDKEVSEMTKKLVIEDNKATIDKDKALGYLQFLTDLLYLQHLKRMRGLKQKVVELRKQSVTEQRLITANFSEIDQFNKTKMPNHVLESKWNAIKTLRTDNKDILVTMNIALKGVEDELKKAEDIVVASRNAAINLNKATSDVLKKRFDEGRKVSSIETNLKIAEQTLTDAETKLKIAEDAANNIRNKFATATETLTKLSEEYKTAADGLTQESSEDEQTNIDQLKTRVDNATAEVNKLEIEDSETDKQLEFARADVVSATKVVDDAKNQVEIAQKKFDEALKSENESKLSSEKVQQLTEQDNSELSELLDKTKQLLLKTVESISAVVTFKEQLNNAEDTFNSFVKKHDDQKLTDEWNRVYKKLQSNSKPATQPNDNTTLLYRMIMIILYMNNGNVNDKIKRKIDEFYREYNEVLKLTPDIDKQIKDYIENYKTLFPDTTSIEIKDIKRRCEKLQLDLSDQYKSQAYDDVTNTENLKLLRSYMILKTLDQLNTKKSSIYVTDALEKIDKEFVDGKVEIYYEKSIMTGGVNYHSIILGDPRRYRKQEESKYCYRVTVDLEVYLGDTLTMHDKETAKCRRKWNSVRKAYADFMGLKYVIPPAIGNAKPKTTHYNTTRKLVGGNSNKHTRKHRSIQE